MTKEMLNPNKVLQVIKDLEYLPNKHDLGHEFNCHHGDRRLLNTLNYLKEKGLIAAKSYYHDSGKPDVAGYISYRFRSLGKDKRVDLIERMMGFTEEDWRHLDASYSQRARHQLKKYEIGMDYEDRSEFLLLCHGHGGLDMGDPETGNVTITKVSCKTLADYLNADHDIGKVNFNGRVVKGDYHKIDSHLINVASDMVDRLNALLKKVLVK